MKYDKFDARGEYLPERKHTVEAHLQELKEEGEEKLEFLRLWKDISKEGYAVDWESGITIKDKEGKVLFHSDNQQYLVEAANLYEGIKSAREKNEERAFESAGMFEKGRLYEKRRLQGKVVDEKIPTRGMPALTYVKKEDAIRGGVEHFSSEEADIYAYWRTLLGRGGHSIERAKDGGVEIKDSQGKIVFSSENADALEERYRGKIEPEEYINYRDREKDGAYIMEENESEVVFKDKDGTILFVSDEPRRLKSIYEHHKEQGLDELMPEKPGEKNQ